MDEQASRKLAGKNSLLRLKRPLQLTKWHEGILFCVIHSYISQTKQFRSASVDLQPVSKLTIKIPNSFVLLSPLELTFLTLWEDGCCFNKTSSVYLSTE